MNQKAFEALLASSILLDLVIIIVVALIYRRH